VAVAIALASSSALAVASPAFAGTLNYNSATRTMTYTGGPGPDAPRWGDQDAQGNIQISVSEEDPMVPTGDSQLCMVTIPAVFIRCPADQVVADLGEGDDRARGGSTNDVLLGGDGNDLLVGGGGADRIDGGVGDDDLSPQSPQEGADGAGDGADNVVGGPGTDLVRYRQTAGSVRISLDDTADDGQPGEGDNIHSDVENVTSATSNDVIVGSSVANVIDSAGGDDSVSGGDGNDTLTSLAGNDVISGDAGDDSLLGGTGSNILDGGPGLDRFGRSAFSCGIFDCSLGVDEFRANDGVQESIDCFGVAGSKAIVDALDIVATAQR
jgi:RTX calcium-binding nonapeptide repeat (4 copies)